MEKKHYLDVRANMRPGDLLAFGGKGALSDVIKSITCSPVSHVGVVYKRSSLNGGQAIVEVAESTSLYGQIGVQINRLSTHINKYDGELWWCPLSDETRNRMSEDAFCAFIEANIGKPYDFIQAMGSAFDWLDKFGLRNKEDFSKFFCSEFYVGALKVSGAIPSDINASEATPIDVCKWKLYSSAVQIKGQAKSIPGFNTVILEV